MKAVYIALFIILVMFAAAIYFYPSMPDKVASHWNAKGEVDSYMSKFWGLFLMTLFAIGLLLLLSVIPKIDPLKKNIAKFRNYFDLFIVLIMLFFAYIYGLTLAWNLGFYYNMTNMIIPALAGLFYFIGIFLEKTKRNWFIGIRTPWTISSERVWNKTHKVASKWFKVAAVIFIVGLFFGDKVVWFVIIPVVVVSFGAIVYSYFEYQKN